MTYGWRYSVDGEECVQPRVGFNTDRSDWTHTEDDSENWKDSWWVSAGKKMLNEILFDS